DFLVDDGLRPDSECSRAEERCQRTANYSLPTLRQPSHQHALSDEKPHPGRSGAAQRGGYVDAHCHIGRDRENREEATKNYKKGIAWWMGQAEGVSGRDVLARVPHRGGRGERDQIKKESQQRRDGSGLVRRPVVEILRRADGCCHQLMTELPLACKYHRDVVLVGRLDHFLVANRS